MKGIILHGGHGTRLRPLTHTGPKQLLPIANKPMSEYCVESLKSAGITDIAIVVGGIGSQKVRDYYGNGEKFGVNFSYVQQNSPKGIAHAINLCKNFISNEKFVVFLGDNIMTKSIINAVKKFKISSIDALLFLCEVDNPSQFGVAEIIDKKIKKIVEKPNQPKSRFAVTGIYFFNPDIFDILSSLTPSSRNELEIVDALQIMIDSNKIIEFEMITEFWKDTGTPNDIITANTKILQTIKHNIPDDLSGIEFSGSISIGEGTTIQKNTKINGPVLIGKNCIIESTALIGPNTSIGDNCHISSCKIENSIVMSNCKITSNIHLKNSIIAFNSKILGKDPIIDYNTLLLGEGTSITL
tara:strand:+ start:561 stop:1625 length:1065 start_codon:yes stop_codon:yes gene_type:complete